MKLLSERLAVWMDPFLAVYPRLAVFKQLSTINYVDPSLYEFCIDNSLLVTIVIAIRNIITSHDSRSLFMSL